MRKLILILLVSLSLTSFAQNKSFTISGKISGHDSKEMRISFYDSKGNRISDKIKVDNGTFSYTNNVLDEMQIVSLGIIPNDRRNPSFTNFGGSSTAIKCFAFPGAAVKISGNVDNFVYAYPSGDIANDDLARYEKALFPLMNESFVLKSKINKKEIVDNGELEKSKKRLEELNDRLSELKKRFIRENPSSVVSAWLLEDMMVRREVSDNEATGFFENMNKAALAGITYYEDVAARILGIKTTAVGDEVPALHATHTYDNKPFDLSSLRGKYVVLDFWGTWCGPCVFGMPKMSEYREKYKSKLEIVGIASESDDGEKWRKFLEKNSNYNWSQVLARPDEDFISKFNVAGFPTKIIIDPKGKILVRFVGEGDDIYNKLDELLK